MTPLERAAQLAEARKKIKGNGDRTLAVQRSLATFARKKAEKLARLKQRYDSLGELRLEYKRRVQVWHELDSILK